MSTTGHNCQPQICRLCLVPTTVSTSLITEGEISRMLKALTSLTISPEDDISTVACFKCVLALKVAYTIQQNMLGAERRFRQSELDRIKQEPSLQENPELMIKEEIVEEHPEEKINNFDLVENHQSFSCDICGAALSSESSLESHRNTFHSNKDNVKSEEHVKVNVFKESIKSRVSTILGRMPGEFNSYICGTRTGSELRLKHRKCPKCDEFIPVEEFKPHVDTHARNDAEVWKKAPLQCKICEKTFKYATNKRKHEKICQDVKSNKFQCKFCEKIFKYATNKRKHEKICQDLKPNKAKPKPDDRPKMYTCDVCGKATPSSRQLLQHKYRYHLQEECPVCHKLLAKSYIRCHINHHKDTLTVCQLCGASVKRLRLSTHIRIYHRSPTHKCKFCDKIFTLRWRMVYHQKKYHLKQADFVCDTCGKTFYRRMHLERHVRTKHLKLRPHVCKFCDVGFCTKYAMMTHQRKHTNETPYKCEDCGEGFRYKVTLKAHLKSKHDVKDELTCECTVCGKKFASQAALASHARIH